MFLVGLTGGIAAGKSTVAELWASLGAEVIDADAFEAFKEKGIYNKEVADSFHDTILSKGGSEHPSILYKRFRGRDADPKALLRRAGLVKP